MVAVVRFPLFDKATTLYVLCSYFEFVCMLDSKGSSGVSAARTYGDVYVYVELVSGTSK